MLGPICRPRRSQFARRFFALIAALAVLLGVGSARALTTPIAGAVAFPANVPLVLPFPAGATIEVLSGYSPTGGSSLHADTDACCKANDYYALDLVYAGEADGGKGKPVAAPLPGKVVKAGWATEGWANYGQRIILEHDLGDGHLYHSLYAHLNAIDAAVTEGADVVAGQPLGELGQSCQGQLSCSSFSMPHLHWAIHRDSSIGGSGTGGSYGGNAVVPEPLDGYEDIVQGSTLVSSNAGRVVCGDGFCTGAETHVSCPADCPVCESIPPGGRTVDETDLCFAKLGSPEYWHLESQGNAGSMLWTYATDDPAPDNRGDWSLVFDEAGDYQVEVYVDPGFAGSTKARYRIVHQGATDEVVVDQSASGGWIELGTFAYSAGDGQSVHLEDDTGEAAADERVLVFDAVRVTRVGGGAGGAGGTGAAATSGAGGSAATATTGGDAADADEGAGEGCGCRVPAPTADDEPLAWALGLALFVAGRRRGRNALPGDRRRSSVRCTGGG